MPTVTSWTANVDWEQDTEPTDDDLDDLLERLPRWSAVGVHRRTSGRVMLTATITLEASSLRYATRDALLLVEHAAGAKATGVEVLSTVEHDRRVLEPSIPDLVGYVEIADLAEVSRQRARQFADIPGFPAAVVETQAGPLRVRAHVEQWLASRNRKPGRPPRSSDHPAEVVQDPGTAKNVTPLTRRTSTTPSGRAR